MKKLLSVIMSAILCLGVVGCKTSSNSTTTNDFSNNNSWQTYSTVTPNLEVANPYTVQDVVKPNLMWNTAELFATNPQTVSVDIESGNDNLSFFKFESVGYAPKNLDSTWVFACVGVPDSSVFPMPTGGYPAVVLVHGGGGQVFTEWVEWWNQKGYVALAFDTYSNQLDANLQKVVNPEGGAPETNGPLADKVDDTENSWAYHVVSNIILSNNILRNRADVNANFVAITGISWGGVATNLASGVDKRFACFAPVYGAGYLYEDSNWANLSNFGGEDKEEWIELYDPSSYIAYNTKPTLFVSGIDDNCFSVEARRKSALLAKGKTFYAQHNDLGHGHVWEKTPEIYEFFEHVIYGDEMTIINGVTQTADVVTLDYSVKKFDTVKFVYTTDYQDDSHLWEFITVTVEPDGQGNYSYTLPKDVKAYLFETYHNDISQYCRFSTPIYTVEKNFVAGGTAQKSEDGFAPKDLGISYERRNGLKTLMAPVWESSLIVNETIAFEGASSSAQLMYTPDTIVAVTDYYGRIQYKEGRDYTITGNKITLTANTRINYWNIDKLYVTTQPTTNLPVLSGDYLGRWFFYSETEPNRHQICVSYTHSDNFGGAIPVGQSDKLPLTLDKLSNGENLRIGVIGDSITVGAGSSKSLRSDPMQGAYVDLIGEYLSARYPSATVTIENEAVGGTNANWGVVNIGRLSECDLAIIAFGMNDAVTSLDSYSTSINAIISSLKAVNPDCEFVLVSPMIPNPNVRGWTGNVPYFEDKLIEIVNSRTDAVLAPMTTMSKAVYDLGKKFIDINSNNINHPNDFLHRIYAQTVLKVMLGDNFTIL